MILTLASVLSAVNISKAAAVSGSGAPTPWEVSITLTKSLMCKAIRNPGLKLCSSIIGAFASCTVLPARPPRMA